MVPKDPMGQPIELGRRGTLIPAAWGKLGLVGKGLRGCVYLVFGAHGTVFAISECILYQLYKNQCWI